MSELSISEKLTYSTIRIECKYSNGSNGTGTGFFYQFCKEEDGSHYPVVITNKHVVSDAIECRLIFTRKDIDGNPSDKNHIKITLPDLSTNLFNHPNKDVDLCAFNISNILEFVEKQNGVNLYFLSLHKGLIPNEDDIDDMTAMEEILMVGYPIGLWDSFNNKPILRKGITATHPKFDYCNKKEILIDAACFPGSSGSPVFIFNEGISKSKTKKLSNSDRYFLLGILYAGPQQNIEGDIEIIDIPTVKRPIAISMIPVNLGLIIKSNRLIELEELYKKAAEANESV
jgi:hypothetical protein